MNLSSLYNGRRGSFFAYAPLIFWAAIILILGSGAGSMTQTSRFIGPLIEYFFPDALPETVVAIHTIIRKIAHLVEYAILAFLAARAFSGSRHASIQRFWMPLSLAVTCIVASADEINQSFQISRTSSGWDVFLDIAGGIFALVLAWLYRRLRHPRPVAQLRNPL